MGHASTSRLESSHHVQTPDGEGPGDGDGSESGCRQVALLGEVLAPLASANEVFSVRLGCWLVVAVPESLADDCWSRYMMPALPLVYLLDQLLAFFLVDAALEDSHGATPIELR